MYQVLYRKWRPRQFSDVVGQPQVTSTLKNELISGRLAHAYLFTGSRGTGKTTCAKILAKAVNCLNPKNGDPCGECELCRGLDNGSVLDVVEIDAASNNGVENIRTLREEANFTPAAAKYRVYIIDEVHMLSIGAFNALLKTLEEPPEHVIFILATTEVHKLPATILSRCQRFDFRRIAPADIADRLTYIAGEENASIEPQAALLLARLADGALRDALSLLDQCLGRSRNVTVDVVTQTAGLAGREHLFRLADAIAGQDAATALLVIDELYTASKDMVRLCEELSSYFRGLMLLKTMKDARDILAVPEEEYQAMAARALPTSLPVILHCLDTTQDTLERMYRGGNRRIEMEMAILRLCSPELDSGTDALVRRIAALERNGAVPAAQLSRLEPQAPRIPEPAPNSTATIPPAASASSAPVVRQELDEVPPWMEEPPPASQEPTFPAPSPVPEASELQEPPKPPAISQAARDSGAPPTLDDLQDLAQPLDVWPEILQTMKEYSRVVAASFAGSTAYVSGEYVLIDAPSPTALELLRRPAQRDKMRDAIKQVTGRTYKLGPYKKPQTEQTKEQDPLKALAESAAAAGIPVIQQ
ncbi:DNA polymerase III subunit gamma/tau [Faecalispora anaeroviscerum]|uniref:DNA polymerase III subunit gamma/tau n=1 Tax=Faecalispora anaeroviscerum TaxID=2991836 RepID=UPI0024B8CA86|nr:DNA polymerase III subunit gamma/tau [Faecalispora anaeroviscerum]